MHENLPFPAHRSTDESPPEETIGFGWFIIIYVSLFTQGSQVWIISGRKNKVKKMKKVNEEDRKGEKTKTKEK